MLYSDAVQSTNICFPVLQHFSTTQFLGFTSSPQALAKTFWISYKLNGLYFDNLHLQIIENISPKASVENSSPQMAILIFEWCGWSPHVWNVFVSLA